MKTYVLLTVVRQMCARAGWSHSKFERSHYAAIDENRPVIVVQAMPDDMILIGQDGKTWIVPASSLIRA